MAVCFPTKIYHFRSHLPLHRVVENVVPRVHLSDQVVKLGSSSSLDLAAARGGPEPDLDRRQSRVSKMVSQAAAEGQQVGDGVVADLWEMIVVNFLKIRNPPCFAT